MLQQADSVRHGSSLNLRHAMFIQHVVSYACVQPALHGLPLESRLKTQV